MSRPRLDDDTMTSRERTMRTARVALLPALVFAVCASAPLATAQNDVIVKKDGASLRGVEITTFTLEGIDYKRGGTDGKVLGHQIASVQWGGAPETFTSAQNALKRGDYANASQLFGDAAGKASRDVLKAEARFLQGKAAVGLAQSDKSAAADAAGVLRAWLGENATNWRVPEALLLLGRALRLGGLVDDAVTTLKQLDDRASAEAWGAIWSARAKYEMAIAQLGAGKALDARSSFQAAASAAESAAKPDSPDLSELRALQVNAKVGEGETYIADKNYSRALEFFRGVANSNDQELAAAGRAGEGEALFLMGQAENKPQTIRQAQIALARASVLDAAGGEVSAKANYYLGKCLRALGVAGEGDSFKARSDAYFDLVVRSYGDSRWAVAARQERGK